MRNLLPNRFPPLHNWTPIKTLFAPVWVPLYFLAILVGYGFMAAFVFFVWADSWIFHGGMTPRERREAGDPTALCDPSLGNPVMDPYLGQRGSWARNPNGSYNWTPGNGTDDGGSGI